MTADRITVLLVDDHTLMRDGIREILSMEQDIDVVGEAADSEGAISAVARHNPDIVLLDVEIPGRQAADTVTQILTLAPACRIIILSMYDGHRLLRRLISVGIRSYLLKSVSRQELISTIRSVFVAPDRMVLSISRESMAQMQDGVDAVLSPNELDVLRLAARALSNAQIATRLGISEAMVKRHLHSVFVKLGAVSRIDAVNKAVAASLIMPPPNADSGARGGAGGQRRPGPVSRAAPATPARPAPSSPSDLRAW
jgi:DNA-binding NarL/FixJ family response regulator